MKKKELYSEKLQSGNRTYFFDVRESRNHSKYLTITESKLEGDDFQRYKIMIFEEDLSNFVQIMNDIVQKINPKESVKKEVYEVNPSAEYSLDSKQQENKEGKIYSVKEIRKVHINAYKPWTKKDDEKLMWYYQKGLSIADLAKAFRRKTGAIRSRIRKLEN